MYYIVASNNEKPEAAELQASTHLVGCFRSVQDAQWSAAGIVAARGFAWAHIINDNAELIETISATSNRLADELAGLFNK